MGLFGRLRDKITHKKQEDDLYGFRSHVLAEPPRFEEEPEMPEPLEPLPTRSSLDQDFQEPIMPRSRLKDLTVEPQGFQKQFDEKPGRDYDILDRLNIIEAQLGAIRSQTETINERLKNMEFRLGARRI